MLTKCFRNFSKCCNFHGSFYGAFKDHNGPFRIGSSSAERCMCPDAPILASNFARPAAALREMIGGPEAVETDPLRRPRH